MGTVDRTVVVVPHLAQGAEVATVVVTEVATVRALASATAATWTVGIAQTVVIAVRARNWRRSMA